MRLHVVRAGHGSPPIVFIHGLGASSATWANCMALLEDRHQLVALDLLGHGASPAPDDASLYTRDGALADIDELLASLSEPAVLVGHSLGGYLALAHAATRPGVARAVVVINTGPGFRDEEKREAWNARSRRNADRFGVAAVAANLNLQHDSVVMDHLPEMAVPTLVLAGELDRPEFVASGNYLERKMPHARLVVIAGGEHNVQETHAPEIVSEMEQFLAAC